MAIRFQCQECHHLLSIASRKVGTVIECPICAAIQVVPDEETAQAALEQAALLQPPPEEPADLAGEDDRLMVLDDLAELAGSGPPLTPPSLAPPSQATAVLPPAETPPPNASPPASPSEAPPPDGSEWILFRRQTIYLQGVMFVLVAVVAFTLGLVIGRFSTYVATVRHSVVAGGESEQVFVEGRLVYDPGKGTLVGDAEAVILILPDGKTPAEPLPIRGLRPQDPAPSESHRELRSLQEFGGIYLRANAEGSFHAVLPQAGKYRLLLISRHASRPEDDPIDEVDRDEIGKYFRRGADLIGRSKYRWTQETFRPGAAPVRHGFGLDGQE